MGFVPEASIDRDRSNMLVIEVEQVSEGIGVLDYLQAALMKLFQIPNPGTDKFSAEMGQVALFPVDFFVVQQDFFSIQKQIYL